MEPLDRKDDHLRICLEEDIDLYRQGSLNGFNSLRFDHDALPEIRKSEIDLSVELFGKRLSAPILIGAMTGGTERAAEINSRLAKAAEICRVGLALGSQRKMLKDSKLLRTYVVKKSDKDIPLLVGNLGAVQLNYGVTKVDIRKLIEQTGCDVFSFHLNPLQESVQPEGDTDFKNLIPKLSELISDLGIPTILKEVGSGISETFATKIKTLPLAGIETGGLGGTSWSKIESLRATHPAQKSVGQTFSRWGIPTAESIQICKKHLGHLTIIGSGGIRNGVEVAKAVALGADCAAMALPVLKAAEKSVDEAINFIETVKEELRIAMFLTGSANIKQLQSRPLRKATDH